MNTKTKLLLGLSLPDMLLLWLTLILWLGLFIVGTLVNSAPYRDRFSVFEGGFTGAVGNGLVVVLTYTLTNVAFLCILSGILGMLGAKAVLVPEEQKMERDTTSPGNSAVLRSFLVYLTLIAGVLVLSDDPTAPTQLQYVRLAGFMSLVGFVVSYKPKIFGRLLQRAGALISEPGNPPQGQDVVGGNVSA